MINVDRRELIASMDGSAAPGLMSDEVKADALEHFLETDCWRRRKVQLRKKTQHFPPCMFPDSPLKGFP